MYVLLIDSSVGIIILTGGVTIKIKRYESLRYASNIILNEIIHNI